MEKDKKNNDEPYAWLDKDEELLVRCILKAIMEDDNIWCG